MADHADDVAGLEFAVRVALRPDDVREAGRRALAAARGQRGTTIREAHVGPAAIRYVVFGRGLVRQMVLHLTWEELAAGRRRVRLTVGEHLVEPNRLLFIPLGPPVVPALPTARAFVAALRDELTGSAARPPTRPALPVPRPARPQASVDSPEVV
ncbi:hypothetical protein [Geodermatophilus marinus]|uniref:hypothetical protein n=1 Tax=Geodermatophilus sp. LHW52908 TaxID=2303986 RepID=UPI0011C18457|nr:hypothetical protein [Geodermatophilus sp. LHW52908]